MIDVSDDLAPGCYGSALAFKNDAPMCSACVFAARCEPLHERNLVTLRDMLGVTAPKVAKRLPKEKPGLAGAFAISPKAQALIDAIEAKGIKVTKALADGISPFAGTGLPTLHIACALLLKNVCRRETMVAAFIKHLNYAAELAEERAATTIQALEAIGAVRVLETQIVIRSN